MSVWKVMSATWVMVESPATLHYHRILFSSFLRDFCAILWPTSSKGLGSKFPEKYDVKFTEGCVKFAFERWIHPTSVNRRFWFWKPTLSSKSLRIHQKLWSGRIEDNLDPGKNHIRKYIKKFLEMIQRLRLWIHNNISTIRRKKVVFRITEVRCLSE